MKRILPLLVLLLTVIAPMSAHAWWDGSWKFRRKVTINTSPTGADLKEGVANSLVAVRLHSGNFLFTDAKPDGSDIRFVAGDDKTPLKFFVESFDSANQLALIWVQVPAIAAASSSQGMYMYSGNEKIGTGGEAKSAYDPQTLLALEFQEAQLPFKDTSAYANTVGGEGAKPDLNGLFASAATFDGSGTLKVTPQASTRIGAGGALTLSLWLKPGASGGRVFAWGPLTVDLDGNSLTATLGKDKVSGGTVPTGAWSHVAIVASDHLSAYVNGQSVASVPSSVPELAGDMLLGDGYHGSMDAVRLLSAARTAAWVQLDAAQGADGKLVSVGESEEGEEGGSSYIKILFASLTPDAKVVIAILGVMFAIAMTVMIRKAMMLVRVSKGNDQFMARFTEDSMSFLDPTSSQSKEFSAAKLPDSNLVRLYETGMRELRWRQEKRRGELSAESVAAIKASIDSTLIRENQRLNRFMVLLTIAISGGPFLGLLGTVVGVMITFAAIAAAGDVNINAIAPGIAAALLATVAGLSVAIPSLFGYNYLITRIKGLAADMQAFTDEFISRMAEAHTEGQ